MRNVGGLQVRCVGRGNAGWEVMVGVWAGGSRLGTARGMCVRVLMCGCVREWAVRSAPVWLSVCMVLTADLLLRCEVVCLVVGLPAFTPAALTAYIPITMYTICACGVQGGS